MSHAPSDQELVRREALQKLRALGIEPFPAAEFLVTSNAREVKGLFKEEGEPAQVIIAGRIMSVRVMGKASFAVLRDHTGDQQIYMARDEVAPARTRRCTTRYGSICCTSVISSAWKAMCSKRAPTRSPCM